MKKMKSLADLLFEDDRLLKEEEEEEGGDDIFGDDDSGDDDSGDEGDDEGSDEESDEGDEEEESDDAGDDEGEDDKGGDEEDSEPQGPADDTIDGEVNNLLADFEAEAVAAAEQSAALQGESKEYLHNTSMSKLIFEADEPTFDVSHFANNIARVIDNYQSLLDVEKMIFDKAKDFISSKYGEVVADEFENALESEHQISFVTGAGSDSSKTSEEIVPVAAGAMTPA